MNYQLAFELQKRLLTLAYKQKENKETKDKDYKNEHEKEEQKNTLSINYTTIQKIPIKVKNILEQNFQNLINITLMNCDLRTFQNFPKFNNLKNLNVSKNSLRGSFEYLVKNSTIKYIDASNNLIVDFFRFQPLRRLQNLSIFVKQNPFQTRVNEGEPSHSKNYFVDQFKKLGIKYLQKSLTALPQVKQQQPKKQQKPLKTSQQSIMRQEIIQKLLKSGRNPKLIEKYLYQYLNQSPNFHRRPNTRKSVAQSQLMPRKIKEADRKNEQQIHNVKQLRVEEPKRETSNSKLSFQIDDEISISVSNQIQIQNADNLLQQDDDADVADQNNDDQNDEENQNQFQFFENRINQSPEQPFGRRVARISPSRQMDLLCDYSEEDDDDNEEQDAG